MTETPTMKIERVFSASRELVWKAWSDPEHLQKWFGPQVETILHKFEFKVDGEWLTEMKMQASSMFSRAQFIEIEPPKRLAFLQSNTDENWTLTPNPMSPDWPKTMLTEVSLEEQGPNTKLTLLWSPHEGSDAENAFFAQGMERFSGGWGMGFDVLETILKDLAQ